MIRVVLDTNVIISAVLNRGGSESYAVKSAIAYKIELCVSDTIVEEYEEVLRRPKFSHIPAQTIDEMLAKIHNVAIVIQPGEALAISPDESDNRFLECAEAADADYLVTGNKRHFPRQWKNTAIIGARELIEILIDAERP